MSQQVDTNTKPFTASGAIAQYARVKQNSDGTVAAAAATDRDIGTATRATFASGDPVAVKLRSAAGTHKMIAAGAITAGALVYSAASGKVSATAATGSYVLGTALEAATADGDVIEVLYNAHGDSAAP